MQICRLLYPSCCSWLAPVCTFHGKSKPGCHIYLAQCVNTNTDFLNYQNIKSCHVTNVSLRCCHTRCLLCHSAPLSFSRPLCAEACWDFTQPTLSLLIKSAIHTLTHTHTQTLTHTYSCTSPFHRPLQHSGLSSPACQRLPQNIPRAAVVLLYQQPAEAGEFCSQPPLPHPLLSPPTGARPIQVGDSRIVLTLTGTGLTHS